MDPLTIITTGWSVFKLGYDVIKFINTEFPENDLDHFRVFVSNEYHAPIYVAIHYSLRGIWQTTAWKIESGQTGLLLGDSYQMKNRIIYAYACNNDISREWTGNEKYSENISGHKREFGEMELGDRYCNYTIDIGA